MESIGTALILLAGVWLLIRHYSRKDWYVIECRMAEGDNARHIACQQPYFMFFIKKFHQDAGFKYAGLDMWVNEETQESVECSHTVFSDYSAAVDVFAELVRQFTSSLPQLQQSENRPRTGYPVVIIWKVRAPSALKAEKIVNQEAVGAFESKTVIRSMDITTKAGTEFKK